MQNDHQGAYRILDVVRVNEGRRSVRVAVHVRNTTEAMPGEASAAERPLPMVEEVCSLALEKVCDVCPGGLLR